MSELTRYWSRKRDTFSCKCEEQENKDDGRVLRKWTHPKTNEPGETWEWNRNEFDGIIEYVDLKKGDYGWDFYIGIQGSMRVNVLQFKVFDANGRMVNTLLPLIRKLPNIDPTKPIHVGLYTPPNQGDYVKTYTVLKQNQQFVDSDGTVSMRIAPVKDSFELDPETKRPIGIPEAEVREGPGGKKIWDFLKRDKFMFEFLEKFVKEKQGEFSANKKTRAPTPAEAEAVRVSANVDDDEPPF